MKKFLSIIIFLFSFIQNNAQCMSGSYEIGGANPDYNSFQEAFDALVLNGVCAPTVFYVNDGLYNEQATLDYFSNSSLRNVIFLGVSQ